MLLGLLAVVHRDGGHHTENVGLERSWQEAMQISSERIAALTASAERIKVLEEALKHYGGHIHGCNVSVRMGGDCYCGWTGTRTALGDL